MTSRFRTSAVLLAATATISAGVFVANPASAAPDTDRLIDAGITARDLPRFARPTPLGTNTLVRRGAFVQGPELCITRNGNVLLGADPRRFVASVTPVNGDLTSLNIESIRSDIYQYRNAARARAAYERLGRQLNRCAYSADVDLTSMGLPVTARARGVVNRLPRSGWAILFKARAGARLPNLPVDALADRYSSFRRSGSSIVRVSWSRADATADSGKNAVNARMKSFVRGAVRKVASRLS